MKRILLAFAAMLLLVRTNSIEAEPTRPAAPAKKINLGIIVPLTGPLAFFGQDYVRAFELVTAAHPEIKNSINVVWEDSAYDAKQAVSVFNKLVSVDHVDIVWSFGGPMLHALAPLAESKKIPFFASESEKSDCEGRAYCSLFRNEEDEWGQATWKVLRRNGRKKIGIVKNQNQFMNTFVNAIVRAKGQDETVEILIDVPPETVDLRSNVLSLKSKQIDALGVYLLPGSHHGFLNAMRNLGRSFPLFGVEEFLVEENNKGFESVIEGALLLAPGATDNYRDSFERKYGKSGGFFYTPAFYDFMDLLHDTVTAKPELRGIELVKALRFDGERSGASGKFSVKISKTGVYSYSFPIFAFKVTTKGVVVDEVITF